ARAPGGGPPDRRLRRVHWVGHAVPDRRRTPPVRTAGPARAGAGASRSSRSASPGRHHAVPPRPAEVNRLGGAVLQLRDTPGGSATTGAAWAGGSVPAVTAAWRARSWRHDPAPSYPYYPASSVLRFVRLVTSAMVKVRMRPAHLATAATTCATTHGMVTM